MLIISGGQTGVDQGALEAALELGWPCGGWCPKGRRSERGAIPSKFPLREATSGVYPQRTRWNVRDSDGTLVVCHGPPAGGTALTVQLANSMQRPVFLIDLSRDTFDTISSSCCEWISKFSIRILNIAGPRESESPGIQQQAKDGLKKLFVLFPMMCGEVDRVNWPPILPTTPPLWPSQPRKGG